MDRATPMAGAGPVPSVAEIGVLSRQAQQAATIAFVSELNRFRREMESILERLPLEPADARRWVTRELAIAPGDDELDTILTIAGDRCSNGPRRELPRRLLLLRVLAEREITRLWRSNRLEPEAIRHSTELAPQLLVELKTLEVEFRDTLLSGQGISEEDREYLLQVVDSLMVRKGPLLAAQLIGPRLEQLATAVSAADARNITPYLEEHEAALFQASDQADGPARVCLDAIALRSLMQEDLKRWCDLGDGKALERRTLQDRLGMEQLAYDAVLERLQQQIDAAVRAGLSGFTEELRSVRNGLSAVYMQMQRALEPGQSAVVTPEGLAAVAMRRPLEQDRAGQVRRGWLRRWLLPAAIALAILGGLALGLIL